jgi:hypothetical protein
VHKHFDTELFSEGFGDPAPGIYAFSMELTLKDGDKTYVSDPLWIVYNNGLSEPQHEAAMAALVPEPATWTMLAVAGVCLAAGWRWSKRRVPARK